MVHDRITRFHYLNHVLLLIPIPFFKLPVLKLSLCIVLCCVVLCVCVCWLCTYTANTIQFCVSLIPDRVWLVHILHDGIGCDLNLTGLRILALYYREYKFNLHEITTGKRLLTWDGDKIRKSGVINSLIYVEAGTRCHGGPGLLWIQPAALYFRNLCQGLQRSVK